MKVGFYHVEQAGPANRDLIAVMVHSVRQALPGVPIWHYTDRMTPAIPGVDARVAIDVAPIALGCLRAYALCEGDWLLLDTDTVVLDGAMVQQVFTQRFDIAVAERTGTLRPKEIGTKFMTRMPFNKGAVYSKSAAFWQSAVERCEEMPVKQQAWMGDQRAMNDVIASQTFQVLRLPSVFNYAPLSRDEDVRSNVVLHYKGKRKDWMRRLVA